MLNLPRWQTIVIIPITVLSGLFALPNLLPNSVLEVLPHWYANSRINLGLDLRGGAHFLLIRPQQSKMKAQREMLSGVKRGDRVVTGGGIIGLVTKVISDNELQVELADGVRVRIVKATITDILTRGESVRGAKDGEDDDKPMLPPPAPAGERKSLLGSLFGGKK